MTVSLRPFTADRLPEVQRWFHHPEVDRRLGGPAMGWPMSSTSPSAAPAPPH
jgi:hypothetical protein